MNSPKKTPVVILNGFLGSGKTTLFRQLMTQSSRKAILACAIVNDMSSLDVDGELLGSLDVIEDNESLMVSIPNCVLSSDKGLVELDKALQKLTTEHAPDVVIIETSGSTHPLPLVEFFRSQESFELVGMLALVDCAMLLQDYAGGQQLIPRLQHNLSLGKRDMSNLLVEQILFASHVLFTKADRLSESALTEMSAVIQAINPYVSAHSVKFGNLPIESLLALEAYDYYRVEQLVAELKPQLCSSIEQDLPYNLATRVIRDDRPFHPKRLWAVCQQYLGDKIYRSKGFFWMASRDKHALLWNQASGSIVLEINGTWRAGVVDDKNHGITEMEIAHLKKQVAKYDSRFGDRHCDLTVIGDQTQVDTFTEALKSCFLTELEIQQWFSGHEFEDPWPTNIVKLKT